MLTKLIFSCLNRSERNMQHLSQTRMLKSFICFIKFETTLFADNTYLVLSDKSITDLECKVNKELIKIDRWLKINILSLNISKSCNMLINNQPYKSCELNLQLSRNLLSLTRQQTVKCLGVFIDDNFKWSTHLSLQLFRCSGIFYRIRNLIPFKVSKMLYYCFIYSRIHYALWFGVTHQNLSQRIIS